jgi:hypothetical protein
MSKTARIALDEDGTAWIYQIGTHRVYVGEGRSAIATITSPSGTERVPVSSNHPVLAEMSRRDETGDFDEDRMATSAEQDEYDRMS